MTALGPPAGGLRLIRIVLLLIGGGVIALTACVVVLFLFNGDRVTQINDERFRNVERNCLDVNRRHDRSIRTLDEILDARLRTATRAERDRLLASRETTVLLIESLTPKRDCARLAREQVSSNP